MVSQSGLLAAITLQAYSQNVIIVNYTAEARAKSSWITGQ
jgi:hypothetical protein